MLTTYEKERISLLTRGIEGVTFNDETFGRAFLALTSTDPVVVVIGPGGTGKSVLIRCLGKIYGNDCLCVAPTGVASHNLEVDGNEASTIHSALGIPVKPYYGEHEVFPKMLTALAGKKKLLIDEASMISSSLLQTILRHVLMTNLNRRSMESRLTVAILCDPLQLPPVFERDKMLPVLEDNPGLDEKWDFFHSELLRDLNPKVFILRTIYRQKDPHFKQVLSNIRVGEPSDQDVDYLNSKVRKDDNAIILCPTNAIVDGVNMKHVAELAKTEIPYAYDAEYTLGSKIKDAGFSEHIELYVGCRVMATRNRYDDAGHAIFHNGTIGTIISFEKGDTGIPVPIMKTDDGKEVSVPIMEFSEGRFVRDPETKKLEYVKVAAAFQIPLKLCYALTFHKSQGLTLPSAHIVIPEHPEPGVLYMGLSRCKDPEQLSLSSKVTKEMFRASKAAKDFLERVEKEGCIR